MRTLAGFFNGILTMQVFTKHSIKNHVIDELIEAAGEAPLPFSARLRIKLHLLFCPRCSEDARKLDLFYDIMHRDFFPQCSDYGETVMNRVYSEAETVSEIPLRSSQSPGGFSTKSWIFAGCFLAVSLAIVFFNFEFTKTSGLQDSSFLLYAGLVLGLILTGYIVLFTVSHLKELSSKFL